MKTTRRGLFGWIAGVAAGSAVVKALPGAPEAVTYIDKAKLPRDWLAWRPVIVDAHGAPLSAEHFRQLLIALEVQGGEEARPDEWIIARETQEWFERWMDEESWRNYAGAGRPGGRLRTMVSGIPLVDNAWMGDRARDEVYASKGEHFKNAVLLGKIVNLGEGRCGALATAISRKKAESLEEGSMWPVRCERPAGHWGDHQTVIAQHKPVDFSLDGGSFGGGAGPVYTAHRWV